MSEPIIEVERVTKQVRDSTGVLTILHDIDFTLNAREGRHYTVRIVSERFAGSTRVARHRLVYHALDRLMPRGIHALAIDARAPHET